MKNRIVVLALFIPICFSFVLSDDSAYEASIKEWHKKRVEDLKAEDGWLNLEGLFWLQEGENTIGGSTQNSIVFPSVHSDNFLGKVFLKEGKVTFMATHNATITQKGEPVSEVELFPYNEKPVVLSHQSLRWFIIQRGDKYAIRLRDLEGEGIRNFKGIETFPINKKWRVKARFVPTEGKKLKITDITGQTYEQDSPGKFTFSVQGREYSLEASGTKSNLYIVFGDATNKYETYGGGRFLDVEIPDNKEIIYLDFNKAYNPPCVFTPYATCPIPTKENTLSLAIRAGEKYKG